MDLKDYPSYTFEVCTMFVYSENREWLFTDFWEEASRFAWKNKPALITIKDPTGMFSGNIEVGVKEHEKMLKGFP